MKNRLAFALLMGLVTTGAISFVLIFLNLGFGGAFLRTWFSSWGLGYLVVLPILLLVGPRLQRWIGSRFSSTTRHSFNAPGTTPLLPRVTFALVMGALSTGVVSFAIILANLGFKDDFAWLWARSWVSGWIVVVPLILAIAPRVQRWVDRALAPAAP